MPSAARGTRRSAESATLFLAGLVLMVLQSLLVRELSAALLSCELTILIVTAAYWTGLSLGYACAGVLTDRWVERIALGTLLLHLGLCVVRIWPLAGLWMGLRGWWVLAWLYVLAVPLPLIYGAILPRIVARREPTTPAALGRAYRVELLGAVVGVGLLMGLSLTTGPWLWFVYLGAVTGLTCLLVRSWRLRALVAAAVLAYVPYAATIQRWQTMQFYAYLKHVPITEILHSSDSPYQKVELVRDAQGGVRCFLNGLEYFNGNTLETFNLLLSEVPAKLLRPKDVLIVGSGSMSSVAHVRPFAGSVTTVEIDRRVYDVSRQHLAAINHLDRFPEHRLVVDDAKHFLRTTRERYDLIVLDLPAPLYIQTGLLYTREFYELVRRCLRPGGAVVLYASGWFIGHNQIAREVVAGVGAVFPELYVASEFSIGMTFVIAGERLPMTQRDLAREISERLPRDTVWIYTRRRAMAEIVKDAKPMSVRHPEAIVRINAWMLKDLWNPASLSRDSRS